MARIHLSLAAAFAIAIGAGLPGSASAEVTSQRAVKCTHTQAEYSAAIKQIAAEIRNTRAAAEQNPLLESDIQYFAAVLADAEYCSRQLSPLATAAAAR